MVPSLWLYSFRFLLSSYSTLVNLPRLFQRTFPFRSGHCRWKVLLDDFENPRGNLVTINASIIFLLLYTGQGFDWPKNDILFQCTPSAWSSHAILLGDASHSMVPCVNVPHKSLDRYPKLFADLEHLVYVSFFFNNIVSMDKDSTAVLKTFGCSALSLSDTTSRPQPHLRLAKRIPSWNWL